MTPSAGPLRIYLDHVSDGEYASDAAQLTAAEALQVIWNGLTDTNPKQSFWPWSRNPKKAVPGLYLWGGVGRGKTWLMDMFFDSLPFADKRRLHFHRFMAAVHEALAEHHDTRDPLPVIAREWSEQFSVLCFDEFYVSDIADAMLLGGLLDALFADGVTLVATSNVAPDDLYRDGLQRARFLPAIDAIKQHCHVMHLGGDTDFRLRLLEKAPTYHHPLGAEAGAEMQAAFERLSSGCTLSPEVAIGGRTFSAHKRAPDVIWFDFDTLCREPRSSNDFIELARSYNTVMLSSVPQMGREDDDAARRFVNLVDEFYDRQVKLLISAETAPQDLYTGQRLSFEFERTASRLIEMQSHDYLARPHLQ